MTDKEIQEFKQRLRATIKSQKWSMYVLCEECGFNKNLLYTMFETENALPSLYVLVTLANKLNVSLDWLVYGDKE